MKVKSKKPVLKGKKKCEEDAPANSVAGGGVYMYPLPMDFKGLKKANDEEESKRKHLSDFLK